MTVYYLGHPNGAIKIGFAKPGREIPRITELTRMYGPLELLAVEPGLLPEERARHRQFSEERLERRREWFRPSPSLIAHIRELIPGDPKALGVPLYSYAKRGRR